MEVVEIRINLKNPNLMDNHIDHSREKRVTCNCLCHSLSPITVTPPICRPFKDLTKLVPRTS